MISRTFIVVATGSVLAACGGHAVQGGSGGTGTGGVAGSTTGGTGGVGGSGGLGSGGSGGFGAGGSGGSGAGGECSADLQAIALANSPPVGFDALPGTPGPVLVAQVLPHALKLSVGPDAGTFTFAWVGPHLTSKFKPGEMVSVGNQDGWDYVMGQSTTAAAWQYLDFVAPNQIADMPGYGPHLELQKQCVFPESSGACGQPPSNVTVFAIGATTGAGILSIPFGTTGTLVGWEVTNMHTVQLPGYGGNDCILEAFFAGVITAIGPALDQA